MHLKRKNTSNIWPIPQKGTKYVIVPSHEKKNGIPLLIVMRDILGFVKTRNELKKILRGGKVEVNSREAREENLTLMLFDVLSLKSEGKHFIVTYSENGKIALEEINEKEIGAKICKVVSKKLIKGSKIQINLNNGRNLISDEKISVGDSVLINFKDGKIKKIFPIKEKSEGLIIKGKHRGKSGIITKVEETEIILKSKDSEVEIKKGELIVLN